MTHALAVRAAGLATATLALIAGCASPTDADPVTEEPQPPTPTETSAVAADPVPAADTRLGDFRPFPDEPLPGSVSASLQAVLDQAVAEDIVRGATAAVVVAGSGNWAGAAGVDRQGDALTSDSRLLTASVGKTVTAAQILRLVDDGTLGLDDLAAAHFSSEMSSFDANGATVRDLLGMRSGLQDPPDFFALVERHATVADISARVPDAFAPAGSTIQYANINFVLLAAIIEQLTGGSLSQATRSGVLAHPDLDGLGYSGAKNALAGDGWDVAADPATLARWGYELYGGRVISASSLREMTDFRGDWYGLGVINFAHPDAGTFDTPVIGHGGSEESHFVRLLAFLRTGLVVSVQANADDFSEVDYVVNRLYEAVQPP
jgi:CubicO group peptidase (beta-lactamase class C family)